MIPAFIVLGLIWVVGFIRLPIMFFYEPGEPKLINLNHLAGVYLRGWKGLWRRKWMLWVFGLVGVVNLLAGLGEQILSTHYLAAKYEESLRNMGAVPVHGFQTLVGKFPEVTRDTLNWFFPRTGLSNYTGGIVLTAAALVIALPWLYLRLGRLRREETYSRDAQFLQIALLSAGVVAVAILATVPRNFILGLQGMAEGSSGSYDPTSMLLITGGAWLLVEAGLNAFLIAGLLGLLKDGGRITVDLFVRNAVCHFRPVAGVYFLLAVVTGIFGLLPLSKTLAQPSYSTLQTYLAVWSIVSAGFLVLMLVPFVIVVRGIGAWEGIKLGVGQWFRSAGQAVSFIALGVTFLIPVLLAKTAIGLLLPQRAVKSIALAPVNVAVDILLTAVMLLAVWEFYQLISKGEMVDQSET